MKHLKLLYGIIIGVGFCLLISANSKPILNEENSWYHLTWAYDNRGFAYDAVTGELKFITLSDAKGSSNIKTLLGK